MSLKVVTALVLLLAIVLLVAFLATRRGPKLPADLQGALEIAREHYQLPALAACVVTLDNVESAVSGVQAGGNYDDITVPDDVVTTDSLWHIGSNAKAVTATLAGMLAEEGALSLDDKLSAAFDVEEHPNFKDVTLRDLLQHRAGLAPFTAGEEFDPVRDKVSTGAPTEQRQAFAKLMLSQPPGIEPGKYEYSNAGYGIAAAFIEARTGRAWEELLREKLFAPLGIRARFGWPATVADPGQPLGHWDEGNGLVPLPTDHDYELPASLDPAGDLSMPIGDYGKFLQLHLRGMRGLPTEVGAEGTKRTLLKPETLKDLHEPNGEYSCGWIEFRFLDLVESSHDGSAGTFYMTATIRADSDVAVAVVANAGTPAAQKAAHHVARRLLDVAARKHAAQPIR